MVVTSSDRFGEHAHAARSLRHPRPLGAAGQPVRPRRDDLRGRSPGRRMQPRGVREDPGDLPRPGRELHRYRNFYTNGHSEKILGDFFAAYPGRREHVVLASKFFGNMFPGDPTAVARAAARSSRSSTRRCAACGPTTWTCTGCITGTAALRSRKPCGPSGWLTPGQLRALDEVSAPVLGYPAPMHGAQRAMLQFAGATVDGEASTVYAPLVDSPVRY